MAPQAVRVGEQASVAHEERLVLEVGNSPHDVCNLVEAQVARNDNAGGAPVAVMRRQPSIVNSCEGGHRHAEARFARISDERLARQDNPMASRDRKAG